MSSDFDMKRWLKDAKKIVSKWKEFDKIVYQLAFQATGYGPGAREAYRKLRELVDAGVLSDKQLVKILRDARRWREMKFRELTETTREEWRRIRDELTGDIEGEEY